MIGLIVIKDVWLEAHPEIRIQLQAQQRAKKLDTQIQEFEKKCRVQEEKNARSIERFMKKVTGDAQKPEDKYPWLPKNLTQKEMDDWSINNVDTIEWADSVFKDPCQEEQVLRELVILDRDHRNLLKNHYRAALKKHLNLNKDEINKIIKDIELRNPKFFVVR